MSDVQYSDITIETIDRAIRDWFDRTVDARVEGANGELGKVPVQFSSGERWSTGRTKQAFRDENGVLILPVIALRRTNIDPDPTKMALGVQTENIQIATRVDPKTAHIKALENMKPATIRRNYPAIYDIYTIPYPDRLVATYQMVVQAQYITQMNEILQRVWRSLDIQKSFVAPFQNDGRHPPRANQYGVSDPYERAKPLSTPYVVGFFDSAAADGSNFEEFTDTERIVKYTTDVRVPFVLQTTTDGERAPVQVQRTAYKVTIKDENVTFVDDPEELDAIFGKLR